MDLAEYMNARIKRLPVISEGIKYDYVNGLRLWYSDMYNEWTESVECVQNGGKTVVSIPIKFVEIYKESKTNEN